MSKFNFPMTKQPAFKCLFKNFIQVFFQKLKKIKRSRIEILRMYFNHPGVLSVDNPVLYGTSIIITYSPL